MDSKKIWKHDRVLFTTAYDLVFICFQIYQTSPYDLVLTSIPENIQQLVMFNYITKLYINIK